MYRSALANTQEFEAVFPFPNSPCSVLHAVNSPTLGPSPRLVRLQQLHSYIPLAPTEARGELAPVPEVHPTV